MQIETLNDLYIEQLKDLYSAEKQLNATLPQLATTAEADELRSMIESGVSGTAREMKKLETLAEAEGATAAGEKCEGMAGLVRELHDLVDQCRTSETRDAAIIAGLQRIKHYEIAGYGCAKAYADRLGKDEATERLGEILEDEANEDAAMTELATSSINRMAVEPAGV